MTPPPVAAAAPEATPVGAASADPGVADRHRFRVTWVVAFLAFTAIGVVWNLAQPLWSGPEETGHFINAQALFEGQIIPPLNKGTTSNSQTTRSLLRNTVAPDQNFRCFIAVPTASAGCRYAKDIPQQRLAVTYVYVAREPPLPSFLAGWPIALDPSNLGLRLARVLDACIGAAALATALALAGSRRRPFLVAGVLVAATPAELSAFGTFGSSQLEVGAATVVFTCVALLADGEALRARFVTLTVAASAVLVLARPISFVYLALAGIALVLLSDRARLAELARSRPVRRGLAVLAPFVVFSLWWAAFVEPPDNPYYLKNMGLGRLVGFTEKADFALSTATVHWTQALGATGYNEYNGPWWMTLGWTLLIGAVVGLGLLCATRRRVLTVAVLAAALVTVPFVSEVLKANTSRLQFQGRYDLPTMAGIILIAAGAVDGWVRTTPRLARMAAPAITLAGALQVTELVGVLHRYSVGIQGSYDPLSWYRHWHAPVNTVVLLVVGAAVIAATYLFFGRYEGGLFADLAALPGWSVPADPGPDRPGPPGDAGPPPRPDRASRARPGARRAPGGDRGGTVVDDGAGANGAGPDGGGDGG